MAIALEQGFDAIGADLRVRWAGNAFEIDVRVRWDEKREVQLTTLRTVVPNNVFTTVVPGQPASPTQPGLRLPSSGRRSAIAAFTVEAATTSDSSMPMHRNFDMVVTWSKAGPSMHS